MPSRNAVFCPVWNQNPDKDTLYICRGEAFKFDKQVVIEAIQNVSLYGPDREPIPQQLTAIGCNSAFPSTNNQGHFPNSFSLISLIFLCVVVIFAISTNLVNLVPILPLHFWHF